MKDLTKDWLEALRSGKYAQTRYTLRDDAGYCCLGVACEVAGLRGRRVNGTWCYRGAARVLPSDVLQVENFEVELLLARMNDAGRSFKQIADEVEKCGYRLLLLDRPDE